MRLFKRLEDHHHDGRRFARGMRGMHPHGDHPFGGRHFGRHGRLARFLEHGDLKMLVLHLIKEKPRHGYEIIKAIEDLAGGAYAPSPGVVYPTLTLLEELGHVESTVEGTRKSFAITQAGAKALADNQTEVNAILARIAAMQPQERAPALIRAIENLRTALQMKLAGKALTPEAARNLADLLDATVRKIEEL